MPAHHALSRIAGAAIGLSVLGLALTAAAATAPVNPPGFTQRIEGLDLSGVWMVDNYIPSAVSVDRRILHTPDGGPAPLQPWAQAIYDKRIADDRAGHPFASTSAFCLPGGVPLMMRGAAYPFQILQTPGVLAFVHEETTVFRLIYMHGRHPDDPDPTFMGHSIAHWDGDTLVVDTVGLTEQTTIDLLGMPHSDKLHVIERYRRIALDKLENRITLDDPGAFTRPWELRMTYSLQPASIRVGEYVCSNQRNQPVNGIPTFH
jgi:hypothetical protein